MPKTCIFCGGGPPFSNEHVLPEWIARATKIGRVRVTRKRSDGRDERTWGSVASFGNTVGSVCEGCNSGWMSELENLARPILSRMFEPTRQQILIPDQQVVLASWLWKIAVLHEDATSARYFNDDERQCLKRGDAPPEGGVHMWLASYRGRKPGNLTGGPATLSAPDGRSVDGFIMSMTLLNFAAQLLCVREMRGVNIETVSRYDFQDAEVLIWPESELVIRWPHRKIIQSQDLFDRWHLRWNRAD